MGGTYIDDFLFSFLIVHFFLFFAIKRERNGTKEREKNAI